MTNGRVTLVCAGLVLVIAACGGSNPADILESQPGIDNVEVDDSGASFTVTDDEGNTLEVEGDEDSITITGEDGESLGTFGSGEIPEDFPIPTLPGSNVQSMIDTGGGTLLILEYSSQDYSYDELVAFYEEFSVSAGITVTGKLEGDSAPQSVSWFLADGGVNYSIAVHDELDNLFLVQFSVN